MGAVLACCAANAVCCCPRTECSCWGFSFGCTKSITVRAYYVVLFLIYSIAAWILSNWAQEIVGWLPQFNSCLATKQCTGPLAVYRVTFALGLFHSIWALVMIGVTSSRDWRAKLQDGFWFIKLFVLVGLTVAAFAIPNPFFMFFGWVALIAAAVFILLQLIMLIDFAHTWNAAWVAKAEENDNKKWFAGLLASTIVMYLGALAMTILMYIFFCKKVDCAQNISFITVNLGVCIIISLISIHPRMRENPEENGPKIGLLQSSLVSFYVTYLVSSAIMSEDPNECMSFAADGPFAMISLILGAIFTCFSVTYSTIRTASTSSLLATPTYALVPFVANDEESGSSLPDEDEDDDINGVQYNYSYFHTIFALGSMYVCMLLSNWHTLATANEGIKVDSGTAAVWIKIVSGWICWLLYCWTIVAPLLFPDRVFA